jgi:phosphoenolpyruvate-protein kinase (PTS system EI component)
MPERTLAGAPASPGIAVGIARVWLYARGVEHRVPTEGRVAEVGRATGALDAAAAELEAIAGRLRAEGRSIEAEIVETGVLMAGDPALSAEVERTIVERGLPASEALLVATEAQAALLDALHEPTLAARAADVRSLGRRAARLANDGADHGARDAAPADTIAVARDLGPADVAELAPTVRGIALASGGVTAHAAIVARSISLPMVVGLGDELLSAPEGQPLIVDGDAGAVTLAPSRQRLTAARATMRTRTRTREHPAKGPAATRDGHDVRILANVSGAREVERALEHGVDGVGLLRTELAFLDAEAWPTYQQHRRMLGPILDNLAGRIATVRLLDFGGDKTPPFLRGRTERGVQLLLRSPDALSAQLRAALEAGRATDLRVLIPMVSGPADVRAVRERLRELLESMPNARMPRLGALIEVPAAVREIDRIAEESDFLSIGTNDLAHLQLGTDRLRAGRAPAHHPEVLGLIGATVRAARRAGIVVEVCGEAASDPIALPLLVGLGVDELSVGVSRIPVVRDWVRALDFSEVQEMADRGLELATIGEVEDLIRPVSDLLLSREAGGDGLGGGGGIFAIGSDS